MSWVRYFLVLNIFDVVLIVGYRFDWWLVGSLCGLDSTDEFSVRRRSDLARRTVTILRDLVIGWRGAADVFALSVSGEAK